MPFLRMNFGRIPYVGAFSLVTDEVALIPRRFKLDGRVLAGALGVRVARAEVWGSPLIGLLLAGNSRGLAASEALGLEEERALRRLGLEVTRVGGRFMTMGNLLLANDRGGIASQDFSDEAIESVSEALGVPIERGTIAGVKTVGSAGVATNKGVLVHPDATEAEIEHLRRALRVPVEVGTACSGDKYVGICAAANSRGVLVGKITTGPELGRIESALGFV